MIYCNGNEIDANYLLKAEKCHSQTGLSEQSGNEIVKPLLRSPKSIASDGQHLAGFSLTQNGGSATHC